MRPSHSESCVNICIVEHFVNSSFFSSNERFCSKSRIYQYTDSESTNNMYAHKMCKSLPAKKRYVSTSDTSFWLAHIHILHIPARAHPFTHSHCSIHFHRLSSKAISWAFFTIKLIKLTDAKSGEQIFIRKFRIKMNVRTKKMRAYEMANSNTTFYLATLECA